MCIGALFGRASNWKHPKYSLRGEWASELWHILKAESTRQCRGCVDTQGEFQNNHVEWQKSDKKEYVHYDS